MPSNTPWLDSSRLSAAQVNEFVEIQSSFLESTITDNEALYVNPKLSHFHAASTFAMPVKTYIERYIEHCEFNEIHLIVAQIFLERYLELHPQFPLTNLNVFRLLATTFYLAHKFSEETEIIFPLSHYAKVGGLSLDETKKLEVQMLKDLQFDLFITPTVYLKYKKAFVDFSFTHARNDGRLYTVVMSQEELDMLDDLSLNPLYRAPENADVSIDPTLLADPVINPQSNLLASGNIGASAAVVDQAVSIDLRLETSPYKFTSLDSTLKQATSGSPMPLPSLESPINPMLLSPLTSNIYTLSFKDLSSPMPSGMYLNRIETQEQANWLTHNWDITFANPFLPSMTIVSLLPAIDSVIPQQEHTSVKSAKRQKTSTAPYVSTEGDFFQAPVSNIDLAP